MMMNCTGWTQVGGRVKRGDETGWGATSFGVGVRPHLCICVTAQVVVLIDARK